jgi:hypothetical protein
MLNAHTESLLQETAIELAFLIPASLDGLSQVADVLAQLGQEAATQSSTEVQQELAGSLALCQQALASQEGLTQAELDGLQASFEKLSNRSMTKPALCWAKTMIWRCSTSSVTRGAICCNKWSKACWCWKKTPSTKKL